MVSGSPRRLPLAAIPAWLREGGRLYVRSAWSGSLFAAVFALLGAAGHVVLVRAGLAPLLYAWAGGFMLVGPALLCGYFETAARLRRGEPVDWRTPWSGLRRSPPALWVVGVLSAFLLMVWLTDAAIIYGLYFGREPVYLHWELLADPDRRDNLRAWFAFTTVAGAFLALSLFAVTAFAVPLLYARRLPLTAAVGRSVRTVFANPLTMLAWGALLTVAIAGSILLFMPAFVVLFPLFAHASEAAYRQACP